MAFPIKILYKLTFWASLVGVLLFVLDFGYEQSSLVQESLNGFYFFIIFLSLVTTAIRYRNGQRNMSHKVVVFDLLAILFAIVVLYVHFSSTEVRTYHTVFYSDNWIKLAIVFTFIREFAEQKILLNRTLLNPAQLFISSFIGVILMGTLLLMLPKATYTGISVWDAFFTSTSAVCVTGLIVVDTGTFFTPMGQFVILMLIQVGGLGILTFASYFGYFFRGNSTYENQLVLSDLLSAKKIGEVFKVLKYVLLITISIESIAALLLFISTKADQFGGFYDRLFFSVFHAVSAFCNAGFSTLTDGLRSPLTQQNYILQLIIAFTFILGGLGFPIVVNLLQYFKYLFLRFWPFSKYSGMYRPWVLNLTSRITLSTTLILIITGCIGFYILEGSGSLSSKSTFGSWVTAFFMATTPRTAGFDVLDLSVLQKPSLFLIIALMWIGASPTSTGGGIKTSTIALAFSNFWSLARGKTRIELYHREVAGTSIRRAFAVIVLSLLSIAIAIMTILVLDPFLEFLPVVFECFSAYSTVGLSLGITPQLGTGSKITLIMLMFFGRVGMLTVLIAIFEKVRPKKYRYSEEEILIN